MGPRVRIPRGQWVWEAQAVTLRSEVTDRAWEGATWTEGEREREGLSGPPEVQVEVGVVSTVRLTLIWSGKGSLARSQLSLPTDSLR